MGQISVEIPPESGSVLSATQHADRILPLDITIARRLGNLMDAARGRGETPGLADLAIAATAAVYDYTVLTRNIRHFQTMGVPVCDPFETLPPES